MPFSEEYLRFCRLRVEPNQVFVINDWYGNGRPLGGIGAKNYSIKEAKWLPNGEIEVIWEDGEIRHYEDFNDWYPV